MQVVNERLRKSHISERIKRLEQGDSIDWATAEALAMGTLLYQGQNSITWECSIVCVLYRV